jgi:hypothetical protein
VSHAIKQGDRAFSACSQAENALDSEDCDHSIWIAPGGSNRVRGPEETRRHLACQIAFLAVRRPPVSAVARPTGKGAAPWADPHLEANLPALSALGAQGYGPIVSVEATIRC